MEGRSSAPALWSAACEKLKGMVGKTAFEQWFEGLAPLALDANSIKLGVSDDFFADWLNDNYADILANALKEAAGRELKFSFESGHAPRPRQEEAPQACAKAFANEGEPEEVEAKNELGIFGRSGRYTFKNFVMGEENRYACTAAMTAAQSPGLYNPLYIYAAQAWARRTFSRPFRTTPSSAIPARWWST
jgi:chromosomal replication initiator protein